ncbi:MAG: hypothetical protein A3I00_09180 [Betaproteobacteria bacterium RIFCSPLOWO2_02_FULL_64_12]|nr:MAG: hypothetical protein A3I00_09180 [Betaproteobacteria bacterium RIFCSPLOWO2_02_FULL_64_12]
MNVLASSLAGFAVFAAALTPAYGQSSAFPSKPIRLITLTSAGGSLDLLARTLAQRLTEQMGQTVVVENRTGAGGNIGADVVAKAAPDGYTIGMCTASTHGINPSLYGAKMPFDALKDFAPITIAAQMSNVLVVNPSLPVKNVAELVAYARANPGKLSFGSAGSGTTQHLSGELFNMVAGVNMIHVPYRGAAAAVPDLVSGRLQLMFISIADGVTHVRAGKLRAIAVTTVKRAGTMPELPTVAEQGYPSFNVSVWFGLVAPANTPPDIVNRYNREIAAALAQPEVKQRLSKLGMDLGTMSPEQFAGFIREEIEKWAKVVKASGARVD